VRLQRWNARHILKCRRVQGLLDREHDVRRDRLDIAREVVHEIVLGKPGEALRVDVEMRERRSGRTLVSSAPIDSPSSSPNAAMYTRPTTCGASGPSAVTI
jgi:hypothetical protein